MHKRLSTICARRKRRNDASIDGVAKALSRFEDSTGHRDFARFHREQAVAFNLHALKALLPTHAGKVDCIFIDPPYNTGNEGWCYSDNVNSLMITEWLKAIPIGLEDGLRHDKWCAMMWPRLRLLHELLAEDASLWMRLAASNPEAIVLDSFAGAGTTAHAVLGANNRDGGSRRFILVEMEDYADRLTAERVRRVINGYAFVGIGV